MPTSTPVTPVAAEPRLLPVGPEGDAVHEPEGMGPLP